MSYVARKYTLQPGQRFVVSIVGREVAVIEADRDFQIAVNDGEPEYIAPGLQLGTNEPFSNIVLLNPHDDPVSVHLGITDGTIKDNRASVSTVLPVRDPDDLSSFSGVVAAIQAQQAAILAMLQISNDQRAALADFSNATAAVLSGAITADFVSSAENVNGVIIRHLVVRGIDNGANVTIDGVALVTVGGKMGTVTVDSVQNIFVPAGKAISAVLGSGCNAHMFYEVL